MSHAKNREHEDFERLERLVHRLERKINHVLFLEGVILAEETAEVEAESARDLDLTQENTMGVITGIAPGATATFALSTLPAGSLLQAGSVPSYTSDNSTDVSALVPSADGFSFSVSGAATFVATSFNVTASAVSLDGTALTKVFNIPLLAPAGVPASDLDLTQTA